jgi:hypothetical protein
MFATSDVFSCRNCGEKTKLIEDDPSDEIFPMIFSVIRCGIVPVMLGGLLIDFFGSSPLFASICYLVIILWTLREREEMHYFLRVGSAENANDVEPSKDL